MVQNYNLLLLTTVLQEKVSKGNYNQSPNVQGEFLTRQIMLEGKVLLFKIF